MIKKQEGRFGTFEGVFTPTMLTIIGVMMYLRLGWVVGNAGLGGALLIILLAKLVTIATGISLSTMATNVKIGHGGSYAFISRSLGTEVGGSIGIPLYLSQALGGALYLVGFSEAWLSIFPAHNPDIVASVALAFLFLASFFSAKIAMKVQYLIMAIIGASLVSFFLSRSPGPVDVVIWGNFPQASFWLTFAIFFPAVTGIEAGISMSGDLRNPGRNLPVGTLSAIGVSMIIYISVAVWFALNQPSGALRADYMIMLKTARWPVLILGGMLGATLSSALGVIVASPRILLSLARDKIVPFSRIFSQLSKNGEPRNAIIFTALFIEVALLLGDLNTIAPLMTMFFLITYGTINLAVLIEKSIGIPSFRPSFNPPLLIPLFGSLWCFLIMFIINPLFAVCAMVIIFLVYLIQVRRNLSAPFGDVRSGLFVAIAEWAAKTASQMPQSAKTWKPKLMVPVEDPENWPRLMEFIRDIVFPKGTIHLFSVKVLSTESAQKKGIPFLSQLLHADQTVEKAEGKTEAQLQHELDELMQPIHAEGVFTTATVVAAYEFLEGMSIITQVVRNAVFPPNIVFLTMSADRTKDKTLDQMVRIVLREKLGVMVLALHPKKGISERQTINIWLRSRSPNRNLSILTALQLRRNCDCAIRLFSVEANDTDKKKTEEILYHIRDYGRMPETTEIAVFVGNFYEIIADTPKADLNIFGASKDLSGKHMHAIAETVNTTCLFVKDSGEESALA